MGVTTEVKKYLHSPDFCKDLVPRYERFEVLCEAGLRTTVAFLLDAKIRALSDLAVKDYRVSCEVHLKGVNVVPDVLIWKGNHPRIWIELKDTKRFEAKKAKADWQKLQDYCKQYPTVKAGYFIYVARQREGDIPIRRDRQTMRLWPIKIALGQHIADFDRSDQEYERRAHYEPPQPKSSGILARQKRSLKR